MTDVLAIRGSARRNGNSDAVLETSLTTLRQEVGDDLTIETITPAELNITPCRSCHGCWDTGQCVINDTMQHVYRQCLQSRHIVVSAPVYFTSLPGHLKVFIDRFQCFWARTYRLANPPEPRRYGMFFCIGAMDRKDFFDSSALIVKTWMSTLNMKCRVARFYPGLDAPKDIEKHGDYLEDAARATREFEGGGSELR